MTVTNAQKLERGRLVEVPTLRGAVLRRVWQDLGWAVEVCSDRQFEALMNGWPAPMPIGFRREDVQPLAQSA